jgi:glutamate/aspartate transport system permease protein
MFANFDFDVIRRSWVYLFQTGMTFTLELTGLAMVGGIILGTLLAMMRLSKFRVLAATATGYVNLIRSIPLVLVIFWFYFLVPYIGAWVIGASEPIMVGHFHRRLLPSSCLRRLTTARSCVPASSRFRAARCSRAMLLA